MSAANSTTYSGVRPSHAFQYFFAFFIVVYTSLYKTLEKEFNMHLKMSILYKQNPFLAQSNFRAGQFLLMHY